MVVSVACRNQDSGARWQAQFTQLSRGAGTAHPAFGGDPVEDGVRQTARRGDDPAGIRRR